MKSTNMAQPRPALYFPPEIGIKLNAAPEEMAEQDTSSMPEERADYQPQIKLRDIERSPKAIFSRTREGGKERPNELMDGTSAQSHEDIEATSPAEENNSRVYLAGIETAAISRPIMSEGLPSPVPEARQPLGVTDSDRKPEVLIQLEARKDEGETRADLPRPDVGTRKVMVNETPIPTQELKDIAAIGKPTPLNPLSAQDSPTVHNNFVYENPNLTFKSKRSKEAIDGEGLEINERGPVTRLLAREERNISAVIKTKQAASADMLESMPVIKPMPTKLYPFSIPKKSTIQSEGGGQVHISIGTIEVRAETTPSQAPPLVQPETYGFEGYELIRSYISWVK